MHLKEGMLQRLSQWISDKRPSPSLSHHESEELELEVEKRTRKGWRCGEGKLQPRMGRGIFYSGSVSDRRPQVPDRAPCIKGGRRKGRVQDACRCTVVEWGVDLACSWGRHGFGADAHRMPFDRFLLVRSERMRWAHQ